MRLRWSIHLWLTTIVLAIAIPLAGMLAYTAYTRTQEDAAQAQAESLNVAKLVAASTQQFIVDAQHSLDSLARRPMIRSPDPQHCDALLKDLRDLNPLFANSGVINLDGLIVCSAVPQPGERLRSVAQTEWFQAVLRTNVFIVGEPFIGPITGRWVSVLAYPLHNDAGRLTGVLALPIDLAHFQTRLAEVSLPPGGTITIADRQGTIVASEPNPGQWIGKNTRDVERIDTGLGAGTDQTQAIGADGVERIYGLTTIPISGWQVNVGIPTAIVFANTRANTTRNGVTALLTVLLVVALTTTLGRQISRPTRALAAATAAAAQGHLDTRVPVAGPAEIADVAERFNALLAARSEMDAALRRSEARFAKAFHGSPIAICISTLSDGRIIDVNERFTDLVGYGRDELIGHTVAELNLPVDSHGEAPLVQMPRDSQSIRDLENQIRNKSGQIRDVLSSIEQLELEGEPCVLTLIQDITERKRLEQQLRQAQKIESIGQLAGGVAHDFNNLLTAIGGYADLALGELPATSPIRDDVREIQKATQRAARLTSQLLAFARKQIIEPHIVDLNALLAETDKLLRRLIGEDVNLVTRLAPSLASVRVDPGQIEQVLINLVVNARDAMPANGEIVIETSNIVLDHDYADQHIDVGPGNYVLLTVSDNGSGMDEDMKRHLFEPFFTTKALGQGTGLGLATCYGIVKQNGGYIQCYSELGYGTTFKIYLPRVNAQADAVSNVADATERVLGSETVLLVEDEQIVRDLAARVLRTHGYTVLIAANGIEAIEIAQNYGAGVIDLLLTDVIMPGMNGKGLSDQITSARSTIKVLFMSGYTNNVLTQYQQLGENLAILQKPFASTALLRKVREVLDQ